MVSTVFTEGSHAGEFILSESNGQRSRENAVVTVAAGARLEAGHVLAALAVGGTHVEYDNTGTDGSEAGAAILYAPCDNSDGVAPLDFKVAVLVRDCEVRRAGLKWAAAVDAAGKTAAEADLAAAHIIVRD